MQNVLCHRRSAQINMLVSLRISEPNRKDRKFFFLLDAVHVEGNVKVFKFFYLRQRHQKLNVFEI